MNQQEVVKEILSFPIAVQKEIVEEIQQNIKRKNQNSNVKELSVEERLAIVESLAGALKIDNPPMTKEEEREAITEYLAEKYK